MTISDTLWGGDKHLGTRLVTLSPPPRQWITRYNQLVYSWTFHLNNQPTTTTLRTFSFFHDLTRAHTSCKIRITDDHGTHAHHIHQLAVSTRPKGTHFGKRCVIVLLCTFYGSILFGYSRSIFAVVVVVVVVGVVFLFLFLFFLVGRRFLKRNMVENERSQAFCSKPHRDLLKHEALIDHELLLVQTNRLPRLIQHSWTLVTGRRYSRRALRTLLLLLMPLRTSTTTTTKSHKHSGLCFIVRIPVHASKAVLLHLGCCCCCCSIFIQQLAACLVIMAVTVAAWIAALALAALEGVIIMIMIINIIIIVVVVVMVVVLSVVAMTIQLHVLGFNLLVSTVQVHHLSDFGPLTRKTETSRRQVQSLSLGLSPSIRTDKDDPWIGHWEGFLY